MVDVREPAPRALFVSASLGAIGTADEAVRLCQIMEHWRAKIVTPLEQEGMATYKLPGHADVGWSPDCHSEDRKEAGHDVMCNQTIKQGMR